MGELRNRIAVKGMPLADLARAARTERNNLRRLLTNTTAAPRLGSVMRLLPALDSWVEPPGARTAAELASFLDSERARHGASWETLVAETGVAAATFARWLREAPERLPLDVVLLIAHRLEVDPRIVEMHAAEPTSHRPESRTPSRRESASRRRRSRSESIPEAAPASTAGPQSQPLPTATAHESSSSAWRLCPPRLGRYRDSLPPPPKPRAQVNSYVPRTPSYELERSVFERLAGTTHDTWRALYRGLYQRLGATVDVPLEDFDALARGTVRWFERLRRPPDANPAAASRIKVVADDVDPTPFLEAWRAARDNPEARTTGQYHDPFGRLHVIHGAAGGRHSVDIRLGQGERPHHLVKVIEVTPLDAEVIDEVEVPLVLKVGDEVRPFTHVRAGPVFGVYWTARRGYLLGALSSVLALVEVDADGARGIWAGFAEDLASTTLAVDPDVETDPPADVGVEPQHGAAVGGTADSAAAELAQTRRQLAEVRAQRTDDEQRARADAAAWERARQELERQLAEVQEQRAADEHRAREDAAVWERERLELQRQLAEVQEQRAANEHRTREDAAAWERERLELQRQLAEVREQRTDDQRRAQEDAQGWERERQELQRQLADEKSARAETEELYKQSATQVVAAMLAMKLELDQLRGGPHEGKQNAPPMRDGQTAPTIGGAGPPPGAEGPAVLTISPVLADDDAAVPSRATVVELRPELGELPPVWSGGTAAITVSREAIERSSEISDTSAPPTSPTPRMAKKLSRKWRR